MSDNKVLDAQANFMIQVHGQKAQSRLLSDIKKSGANANSPDVQRLKYLLRRVTEILKRQAS